MNPNQKTYSAGYNLLFNIIAILSEEFFALTNKIVDTCGIPQNQGTYS